MIKAAIKTDYEMAYERETDCVCQIVNENPHKAEYAAVIVPVQSMQVRRQSAKCMRTARRILGIASTVCATLTVVAAVNGSWQSAFAGAALLLVAQICARITD